MLIEFDCKKCRNYVREHALDDWWREPHPGVCLSCRAKDVMPPPTVEHVRVRQDREECAAVGVLVVPLVIMACAVILAILMGAPQ